MFASSAIAYFLALHLPLGNALIISSREPPTLCSNQPISLNLLFAPIGVLDFLIFHALQILHFELGNLRFHIFYAFLCLLERDWLSIIMNPIPQNSQAVKLRINDRII